MDWKVDLVISTKIGFKRGVTMETVVLNVLLLLVMAGIVLMLFLAFKPISEDVKNKVYPPEREVVVAPILFSRKLDRRFIGQSVICNEHDVRNECLKQETEGLEWTGEWIWIAR